jgi:hypothetical protein
VQAMPCFECKLSKISEIAFAFTGHYRACISYSPYWPWS